MYKVVGLDVKCLHNDTELSQETLNVSVTLNPCMTMYELMSVNDITTVV